MADLGLAQVLNGGPVDETWFNAVADSLQGHEDQLSGTWTDYVPTWDGSTTDPVIGNGVLSGQWIRTANSDLVHFRIRITAGSTTTFGSGFYTFGFPTTPAPSPSGLSYFTCCAIAVDNSAASRIPLTADPFGGGFVLAASTGAVASPTAPFTFDDPDWIIIDGWYEPV